MSEREQIQGIPQQERADGIKQLVQSQFAGSAQQFVESKLHRDGDDLRRMVELAELTGSERVLDVATGGGHTALAFARHTREVVASDLTPKMLTVAEQFIHSQGQTNVQFMRADAESMPFSASEFDVVTARLAPHHFPNPHRFVSEVARVLKTGGRFILDDNMGPEDDDLDDFMDRFERWRDPSHVRALKLSVWRSICEDHHLRVIHTDPLTKKVYPYREWTERMRLPPEQTESLAQWIMTSPPHCKEFFDVQIVDGNLVSLCATFGILVAVK